MRADRVPWHATFERDGKGGYRARYLYASPWELIAPPIVDQLEPPVHIVARGIRAEQGELL